MSCSRNQLLAVVFFTIYLLFYSSFMLINAWAPSLMEITPLAGVNLAIWYGFALIFSAVLLAFIYGMLCQSPVSKSSRSDSAEQDSSSGNGSSAEKSEGGQQ